MCKSFFGGFLCLTDPCPFLLLFFFSVLIGVGLLSLPMGIKYAGWICGMIIMAGAALVTAYTAGLLAKCMDLDPIVITFSDLAYISFGPRARVATSVLFTLELLAACVALIVLFADSLELLFPGFLSVTGWKILCSLAMMPLQFLPLRLLSFTSIVGILCCFGSECPDKTYLYPLFSTKNELDRLTCVCVSVCEF